MRFVCVKCAIFEPWAQGQAKLDRMHAYLDAFFRKMALVMDATSASVVQHVSGVAPPYATTRRT